MGEPEAHDDGLLLEIRGKPAGFEERYSIKTPHRRMQGKS